MQYIKQNISRGDNGAEGVGVKGEVVVRLVGLKLTKADVFGIREPQARGFLAAQTSASLFVAAEPLVKSRVLGADFGDGLLAVAQHDGAEPVFVKQRALPVFLFYIVLAAVAGDVLAKRVVKGFVAVIGIVVYLDVPAHTAAVIGTA